MFTYTHGGGRGMGQRAKWVALFGFLVTIAFPAEAQTGTTRVVLAADPTSITDQNTLTYVITVSNSSLTVTSEVTCSVAQPGHLWVTGLSATNPDSVAVAEVFTNYSLSFEWRSGPIRPGRAAVFTMTGDLWDGLQVSAVTNVVHVNVRYTNSLPSSESFAVTNVAPVSNNDADSMADFVDPDDDNDGMADYWERYFGLDPRDAADASLDPDLDGRPNIQEYQEHSHPLIYGDYPGSGYLVVDNIDPDASDVTGFPFRTIRGALRAAFTGDTVEVRAGTYTGNVTLARAIHITGWDSSTVIIGSTSTLGSILQVLPGVTASVDHVVLASGRAERGGAVFNEGTLSLSNVLFSGSCAIGHTLDSYSYPAYFELAQGGALFNARNGRLGIYHCAFETNSAVGQGSNSGGYPGYGGAIYNDGVVTMRHSSLRGNFAMGGPCRPDTPAAGEATEGPCIRARAESVPWNTVPSSAMLRIRDRPSIQGQRLAAAYSMPAS